MALDREEAAYQARRDELLRDCRGQYVVFVGDEMLGPYATNLEALRAAYDRFGYVDIMLRHVGHDEEPVFIGGASLDE